jgi:hypothetical protein
MTFVPQTPGITLAIVKDFVTLDPLILFETTASGGAPSANIPVLRPAAVRLTLAGNRN